MAPDIAVVGEAGDREAPRPLLLTLSSGANGYAAAIRAGSGHQRARLRLIGQLADTAKELPMSALRSLSSERSTS